MNGNKISFVIPCYNSSKTISKVIDEISNTFEDSDYEIILVNDGSKDNTWSVISQITKSNKNIKAINFSKNFGQHAALIAGYRNVNGELVISLDDDGQTPVNETIKLIEEIEKGYDVVYASYTEKKHSIFRNIGSFFNQKMCEWLIHKPKGITINSFFVARKYIIDEVVKYENPYTYIPGLVLRCTDNISSVEVVHRDRKVGKSGYTLRKLIALWISGFTAFSIKPLRIVSVLGMMVASVGLIYFIYTIIHKILNPKTAMGWTSTISIILIIGGMVLFVLGMIGEYLGRVYMSINKEPQYVIKNRTTSNSKEDNREEF